MTFANYRKKALILLVAVIFASLGRTQNACPGNQYEYYNMDTTDHLTWHPKDSLVVLYMSQHHILDNLDTNIYDKTARRDIALRLFDYYDRMQDSLYQYMLNRPVLECVHSIPLAKIIHPLLFSSVSRIVCTGVLCKSLSNLEDTSYLDFFCYVTLGRMSHGLENTVVDVSVRAIPNIAFAPTHAAEYSQYACYVDDVLCLFHFFDEDLPLGFLKPMDESLNINIYTFDIDDTGMGRKDTWNRIIGFCQENFQLQPVESIMGNQ